MARTYTEYTTPGGGVVTVRTSLLKALVGEGSWFDCTGCGTKQCPQEWDSEISTMSADLDNTNETAAKHAAACRRIPR